VQGTWAKGAKGTQPRGCVRLEPDKWTNASASDPHPYQKKFPFGKIRIGVDECDAGDESWIDTYDAVMGLVAAKHENVELHIVDFQTLVDAVRGVPSKSWPEKVDVLVPGNWLLNYGRTAACNDARDLQSFRMELLNFQMAQSLLVIPPVAHAWHFDAKHEYLPEAQQLCRSQQSLQDLKVNVVPFQIVWENTKKCLATVRGFGDFGSHGTFVSKRSHSGSCVGVTKHENYDNWAAKLLKRKTRLPFPEIVQRYELLYESQCEFKMFVVNGKCRYGSKTKNARGEFSYESVHAHSPWLWPQQGVFAARIAEEVCRLVGKTRPGANHFLRVDLLCTNLLEAASTEWFLNELEYFGDAHIPIDNFDGETGLHLLDALVDALFGLIFSDNLS
jgi:hypothetical protein